MKTFWVNGKKIPTNEISKPIRPISPMYETNRRSSKSIKQGKEKADVWPRHKSVPSVLVPQKQSRESLTPERWPELDDSMFTTPDPSPTRRKISSEAIPGINIEEIQRLSTLTQESNNGAVNISTLTELVQYTEENAQRSRKVADWAKTMLTLAESKSLNNKEENKSNQLTSINESLETPPTEEEQYLPDKQYRICLLM